MNGFLSQGFIFIFKNIHPFYAAKELSCCSHIPIMYYMRHAYQDLLGCDEVFL